MFESSSLSTNSTTTNSPLTDSIAEAFSQMPYNTQLKEFNIIKTKIMDILGVKSNTKYSSSLNHYLRNGSHFLPIEGMQEENISALKNNYLLLQDIVTRSALLSSDQKETFLMKIKESHDDPTVVDGDFTDTHNHITIMHQIMEDVLSAKQ